MTSRAPDWTAGLRSAPHICVLGGGFGGLYTALYLQRLVKRHGPDGRPPLRITLVEPKERFLFTPLLYEVITGELQPWHIAPSYGKLLGATAVQVRRALVQGVDLDRRLVSLDSGETLDYDYLVLAVGSRNRLAVDGAASHAQPFRSLADAELLNERLWELEASGRSSQIAVIGGGPNGIEIACKLADRLGDRTQIHLIDRGDRLLKTFSIGSQRAANRALAQRGVRLHLETGVEAIAADRVTLSQNGQPFDLPADL
ncbi:MAG TPA: FAD-dependent oxidoreductase, partial [Chroococcidiopsis sp.]